MVFSELKNYPYRHFIEKFADDKMNKKKIQRFLCEFFRMKKLILSIPDKKFAFHLLYKLQKERLYKDWILPKALADELHGFVQYSLNKEHKESDSKQRESS